MCKYCINKSLLLIDYYQKHLSPDHSSWSKDYYPAGYCKYIPTCSEYTKLSINKYGFIKGWFKGIWLILRCNPFSKGGNDLP
ncbi:MAG: membrane protein insertion efficiency factor YidD [Candidatus Gracilibacteria bacterium]